MFTAALVILAKKQRKSKHPAIEWINKTWYVHAMEYYTAIKRNEVLLLYALHG